MKFNHLDKYGKAKIVDIAHKKFSLRSAKAVATVIMNEEAFSLLEKDTSKKGNVLSVAQLAGIMAGKKTHELIPLCHLIPTSSINVSFEINKNMNEVKVFGNAKANYNTGVEMEALTAATVASLTIYDMIKSVDKGAVIQSIHLLEKKGGKSGTYKA